MRFLSYILLEFDFAKKELFIAPFDNFYVLLYCCDGGVPVSLLKKAEK